MASRACTVGQELWSGLFAARGAMRRRNESRSSAHDSINRGEPRKERSHSSNSPRGMQDCRMIERSVPILSSLWSGTGTVVVPEDVFCCITMWLPRFRTLWKPWRSSITHTCLPESTRSLANRNLKLGDVDFAMQSIADLFRRSTVEEQTQCFC